MKEDYAIVLDYLPRGYATSFKREPVAQAIGENFFTLLELMPKPNIALALRERVYIGEAERDKVQYIKGRLTYDRLTTTGRNELESVVPDMVKRNEARFIEFFNKAGPITVRQHSLELLPNIGKKHMWALLEEREKKPFEGFKDLCERVKLMPDPVRVLANRILQELEGSSKYMLFVRAPARM